MGADLDQHIGLWDIDGVVSNLGQEHRADLSHISMPQHTLRTRHGCQGMIAILGTVFNTPG